MTKFCIICGKELTGRQRKICSNRECHIKRKSELDHKYYLNNQKRIKENCHNYYQNNREKINENSREYRRDNSEKVKESICKWRQKNPEKIKEGGRNYRHKNLEEIKEKDRKRYRNIRGLPEDCDLHEESSIEVIMREWLQENDIEFIPQHYIDLENSTWTHVDFYIPGANICIYVDGDYWHSLIEVQERDIRNNRILEEMRYDVIRVTETEILEGNKDKLAQCLGVNKNDPENHER